MNQLNPKRMNRMRSLCLLSILCSVFCLGNTGKSQTITIRYDTAKKMFSADRNWVRVKEPEQEFIMQGYNYELYNPSLKLQSKRFKVIVPDALKSYVSLADFSREIDLKAREIPDLPALHTVISIQKDLELKIEKVNSEIITKSNQTRETRSKLRNKSNSPVQINSLNENIKKLESSLEDLKSQKNSLQEQYAQLQAQHPIYNTLGTFSTHYQKIEQAETVLTKLTKELKKNTNDIATCTNLINAALKDLNSIFNVSTFSELQKAFLHSVNVCAALAESLSIQLGNGTLPLDATLQESIDLALIHAQIINSIKEDLISSLKNFERLLDRKQVLNEKLNDHKGDYVNLKIRLTNKLNLKDTVLLQDIQLYSKGGWDVDFSVGLAFNNIYKRTWYVDTVQTVSIREETTFKGDLAFSALINISNRIAPNFRLGGSFGPGISLIDANARYFLGLHAYYGKRDIVGLSTGLCFGKRNFLSSTLSDDGTEPLPNLPANLTAVTTYEKHTTGFYVGLFYNFARL